MVSYLDFKDSMCKDCYKCLRFCPVKAIKIVNHQARIVESRCILCGKCTEVCPQNAKRVHSDSELIIEMLKQDEMVIASIAPSFVSSFAIDDFSIMYQALIKLGFDHAEETAVGAKVVTAQYKNLLAKNDYQNFITSACPAVNEMIKMYYPEALPYLAPVDSPMVAHAKMIKKAYPMAKVVFIGPCIAKKKEGFESKIIDGVLTFEDLEELFTRYHIDLKAISSLVVEDKMFNKAKFYPISRGIIKSFDKYIDGYEFVAVDGIDKCKEVLNNIEQLSGMFLELSACEYSCVNGPCSLIKKSTAVKANADIRHYANQGTSGNDISDLIALDQLDLSCVHQPRKPIEYQPSPSEITYILSQTGKLKPEDELNCGACGYDSCKEKAWAVANGYAAIEMCIPYMRSRAESMSYEIIQNSPNGIVLIDNDLKIIEINQKAKVLLGINEENVKDQKLYDHYDIADFLMVLDRKENIHRVKRYIEKTRTYVEVSIIYIEKDNVTFAIFKDITEKEDYDKRLKEMKLNTLQTTDEVIKKQMRVAQEIASLLGETTAETKVALVKLKQMLKEDDEYR
ncbi:MAG: [Fe-Fe] hydrogenase large subunit C-terminal domain-containing protein [Erysipelotrichaceae bacterium]|nr:[Fe-Fe] hydrogenase large subunit C-terminal domain-containing protein [Erysipelotrichaceae bacterium]